MAKLFNLPLFPIDILLPTNTVLALSSIDALLTRLDSEVLKGSEET